MKVTGITKEAMFKLVESYASGVNGMYRDDYFAMAKSVDDCHFEIDGDKAVLKFKGVEIYPDDFDGEKEQINPWETTATLYLDSRWYDTEVGNLYRYLLEVREDYAIDRSITDKFSPSEDLLIVCGIEVAG